MKYVAASLALVLLVPCVRAEDPQARAIELQFPKDVSDKPFTGRVIVMLTQRAPAVLTGGVNWFRPEPTFAKDVKEWKPGDVLKVDRFALAFPASLDKVPAGTWYAQAVMDFGRGISFSTSEGNIYSKPVKYDLGSAEKVSLALDQVYKPKPFPETDDVKLCEIESRLLSKFHGHPVKLRAAIALPAGFKTNPKTNYPIIYSVPGFGGNHEAALGLARRKATDVAGTEFLYAALDPSCPLGHTVFADSENNGPWGEALVTELIPEIERRFRALGTPAARFVTGHSSGGWSSLWLQVAYPDAFGGCWSTSPDPVDFRDFQRINLYESPNMFSDGLLARRPLGRRGFVPALFYKDFSDMEEVMGHGGQLASFEAVFSPKAGDGKPKPLWDRKTGVIDREVARSWEKYDIRLVLERNWKALEPRLKNKIHVYMGDRDTFYLEGATRLLGESLKVLGSDAVVELVPGKDHGTLLDAGMRQRINSEMAAQFHKRADR